MRRMNEIGRPEIGRPRGGKRSPYRRGAQLLLVGLVALAAYTIRAANAAGDDPCDPARAEPDRVRELASRATRRASGTSAAPATPASRASPPTSASTRARPSRFKIDTTATRLPPRHLPDGLLRRRRRAQGRDRPAVGAALPQNQPACLTDATTGLIDCGNWAVSASWAVPADAVSGIYFAKLVRDGHRPARATSSSSSATTRATPTCCSRPPTRPGRPTTSYGGNSLYVGGPGTDPGRAYKVSYNRPFTTRGTTRRGLRRSTPSTRWSAGSRRNGYDVSYFTGVDTDRRGARDPRTTRCSCRSATTSTGRATQRANVEAARDAGRQPRVLQRQRGASGRPAGRTASTARARAYRTLVSYKETHANAKIDPIADAGPAPGATRASARRPTAAGPRTR